MCNRAAYEYVFRIPTSYWFRAGRAVAAGSHWLVTSLLVLSLHQTQTGSRILFAPIPSHRYGISVSPLFFRLCSISCIGKPGNYRARKLCLDVRPGWRAANPPIYVAGTRTSHCEKWFVGVVDAAGEGAHSWFCMRCSSSLSTTHLVNFGQFETKF